MERQVLNINQAYFWLSFPADIEAISSAEFVSFDLEMTGVKARIDKPTAPLTQHIYQQAKGAAQIFNILQVGISCASYDGDSGAYRVRSFNFGLTPMLKEVAKVPTLARKSNGFSLEKAFAVGIPYLSRAEARMAQGLYDQSRETVERSLGSSSRAFETRTGIHGPSWRQEAKVWLFRYVIEAVFWLRIRRRDRSQDFCDPDASELTLDRAQGRLKVAETRLKNEPPFIVGHSSLFDLCFLYETFIGRLPDDITSFTEDIHSLFPRLVDTEHLTSAQGTGDRNLLKLYQLYKREQFPRIFPKTNDSCYRNHQPAHQAGFDSFMTMTVFLKASTEMAKMEKCLWYKRRVEEAKDSSSQPSVAEAFAKLNPFAPEFVGKGVSPKLSVASSEAGSGKDQNDEEKRSIPGWETEFWAKYANKIRMGSKAVLDLEGMKEEVEENQQGPTREEGEEEEGETEEV
ncbi:ribonuclease H-like domain-containing protein [Immersiella caudata]|uniref:Ribonuclease H-like domain-containing protein n=1 Tax=Immersiella caudata TaxID=314043 RepID=A0AA39WX38_9PEZI|nr:ribonuclease H-like domain-containing protein [Immersiella caudata]